MQTTMIARTDLPGPSRRPCILIVDDDRDSREALAGLLELDGYQVECAPDGSSALILVNAHVPDVVFLDIHMPEMDGYAVCRRMRSMQELRGLRIVALTAMDSETHTRERIRAGFDDQLTKPFDLDALTRLLPPLLH